MNKIEKNACKEYPESKYPCDKPSLFEDRRVVMELRNAFVRGSEKMLEDVVEWLNQIDGKYHDSEGVFWISDLVEDLKIDMRQ